MNDSWKLYCWVYERHNGRFGIILHDLSYAPVPAGQAPPVLPCPVLQTTPVEETP